MLRRISAPARRFAAAVHFLDQTDIAPVGAPSIATARHVDHWRYKMETRGGASGMTVRRLVGRACGHARAAEKASSHF